MLELWFLDKMRDINFFRTENSLFFKKIKNKSDVKKDDECDGYFIKNSEKEIRRIIESLKGSGKKFAVFGLDNAFNRRAIETLKINYLISPDFGSLPDTLKQRDSGLNHVLAKEATKKGVKIIIDFNRIKKLTPDKKKKIISKIIQNIKICRKAGCEIKIASFAVKNSEIVDEKSRIAFGASLGMSSSQTRDCVNF